MTNNTPGIYPAPKLLTVIMDRDDSKKLEDILREKHVHFHFMFSAAGTASSEILEAFGLSGSEKTVYICIEQAVKIQTLMTSVVERLEFVRPGRGIAFILPISGVCSAVSHVFKSDFDRQSERWANWMETGMEKTTQETRCQLVIAVVNKGFSDVVMDEAKRAGARGGTIVHAWRTGVEDTVKFFGISLQAEKELVAIVARHDQKSALMTAINKACGIRSEAHGIVISLPIESCAGIELGGAGAAAAAAAPANE